MARARCDASSTNYSSSSKQRKKKEDGATRSFPESRPVRALRLRLRVGCKKILFLQQVELLSRKKEEPVVSFRVRLLDAGVDAVNVTTVVSFKAGVVIL